MTLRARAGRSLAASVSLVALLVGAACGDGRPIVEMQDWEVHVFYRGVGAGSIGSAYGACGSDDGRGGPAAAQRSAFSAACGDVVEQLRRRGACGWDETCLRGCLTDGRREVAGCEAVRRHDPGLKNPNEIHLAPGLVPR